MSVILATDIRKGKKILFNNEPYVVVEFQWVKPGKGGAYIRTKMKNMISGTMREETFRSSEKIETPNLDYREMQYLYPDGQMYNFMDQESYEQIAFNESQIEEVKNYLKEQIIYTILYFNGRPIAVTPPMFMDLAVTEAPPGVRGDTAQGAATKPATLETGLVLQVPLFVDAGDIIRVDTREDKYIERVKQAA